MLTRQRPLRNESAGQADPLTLIRFRGPRIDDQAASAAKLTLVPAEDARMRGYARAIAAAEVASYGPAAAGTFRRCAEDITFEWGRDLFLMCAEEAEKLVATS